MTFQLRYLGEGDRDPETLTCGCLEDAMTTARRRLQENDVTAVALMSDGFVIRTLTRDDRPSARIDGQVLANAGIYCFGSSSPGGGDAAPWSESRAEAPGFVGARAAERPGRPR